MSDYTYVYAGDARRIIDENDLKISVPADVGDRDVVMLVVRRPDIRTRPDTRTREEEMEDLQARIDELEAVG